MSADQAIEPIGGGDLLDQLRRQWQASGQQGDFDFSEFVSGITIVNQLIEREFKRHALAEFGLSAGDVRILLALRRAAQPLRPADLVKLMLVTSGAITKQIGRLEKGGFVIRVFNSEVQRGWLIVLTKKGKRVTDRSQGETESLPIIRGVFNRLSADHRKDLLAMLHRLVADIQAHTRDNPID